jgi:hypothetical protein
MARMSDDKKRELGLTANTLITIASGVLITWLLWSMRVQVDELRAEVKTAILQSEKEASAQFVERAEFSTTVEQLRQADANNAAAIASVAGNASKISQDIAEIRGELKDHGTKLIEIKPGS